MYTVMALVPLPQTQQALALSAIEAVEEVAEAIHHLWHAILHGVAWYRQQAFGGLAIQLIGSEQFFHFAVGVMAQLPNLVMDFVHLAVHGLQTFQLAAIQSQLAADTAQHPAGHPATLAVVSMKQSHISLLPWS